MNEVSKAVSCIEDFSLVSGLKININKSVLFPLKDCVLQEVYGIPIKDKVTYLGIVICKDEKQRSELNFNPIIEKTKKKLNLWLLRDISLYGRVLLSKAEGLSRSVYVSLSLDLPPKIVKDLDKILYNFIWRNKPHYLWRDILTNTQEQGGLEVLDFNTLNNTFKINWILKYVKNQNSIWNVFPKYLFHSVGGLEFFLRCYFDVGKIPVKLAKFHKQAILAWMLAYKHNFSPHRYFIWNNKDIRFKNKSLFFRNWFENKIILVGQLLNEDGYLLSYGEFLDKFKIQNNPERICNCFWCDSKGGCISFKFLCGWCK